MANYVLAIDQGTTSSRAMLFDQKLSPRHTSQMEFTQHLPKSGWVEHDPDDIIRSVLSTAQTAVTQANIDSKDIAAIGITNQRETTIVWDKTNGRPVFHAIVWQDRRTSEFCQELKKTGVEKDVMKKTGLLLDPYFSGTKIRWILDNVEGARNKAETGRLAFGTVDTYLIWHLTEGKSHVTDATNACRTLLFNLQTQDWDDDLLKLFEIPRSMLPEIKDCADEFGTTGFLGSDIPISGVAGDQHAATIGQACFKPGMLKSTYGTGCFAVLNTGSDIIHSSNRLLTTMAYRLNGKPTYALEGSIFVAGAAVQWIRDKLEIINDASETTQMVERSDLDQEVYLVPAFTGLGAPYWDADCRGAIYGLTRSTSGADITRAALESVGYQTKDLFNAMQDDVKNGTDSTVLRVDGGMVVSDWTMQFLADILDAPVDRPVINETTALGAAWLAGTKSGIYPGQEEFASSWSLDRRFEPQMGTLEREKRYKGWKDAVSRTLSR